MFISYFVVLYSEIIRKFWPFYGIFWKEKESWERERQRNKERERKSIKCTENKLRAFKTEIYFLKLSKYFLYFSYLCMYYLTQLCAAYSVADTVLNVLNMLSQLRNHRRFCIYETERVYYKKSIHITLMSSWKIKWLPNIKMQCDILKIRKSSRM